MRIYESDKGNVYTNAISKLADNRDVEGHLYQFTSGTKQQELHFQIGPSTECGFNGTTNEAVIAAVIHRLKYLNSRVVPVPGSSVGAIQSLSCHENALAITKLEEALMWLEARTKNRVARGVEGKHEA